MSSFSCEEPIKIKIVKLTNELTHTQIIISFSSIKMNWTHRRPFRYQMNSVVPSTNKIQQLNNRPRTFREHFHVPKQSISDQPIDAIRLQLADYNNSSHHPCPVHQQRRDHPYITTFSDQQSSIRRARSSIHSISTIETDFVHQSFYKIESVFCFN